MMAGKDMIGNNTSYGRERPHEGFYSPAMARKGVGGWSIDALPIPSSMPNLALSEVGVGDPKGAGVLTTSQRYSRKEHRQTHVFCSSSLTFLLSPTPITTFQSNIKQLQ